MISPTLPILFQVYDSDCCDSILLELREYLPKYFGVWSPPTAPNGTVLILSWKFFWRLIFGSCELHRGFLDLFWNTLTFPLTAGSSLQSCGWIRSLESSSQGRWWGVAVCTAKVSWVAGLDAHWPRAPAQGGVMVEEWAGCVVHLCPARWSKQEAFYGFGRKERCTLWGWGSIQTGNCCCVSRGWIPSLYLTTHSTYFSRCYGGEFCLSSSV